MFNFIWPVCLIVISNTVYQICAKSLPAGLNPLASLTVTYAVSTVLAGTLYFLLGASTGGSLLHQYRMLNWAPFVLGIVLVGLEVGTIYGYKAGWQVSTLPVVYNSFLAVVLIFVGWLVFRETITWNKIVGIGICLAGIIVINYK